MKEYIKETIASKNIICVIRALLYFLYWVGLCF